MVTTTSSKTEIVNSNNIKKVKNMKRKVLNEDTINPCIKRCEYAVRGELAIRAEELREVINIILLLFFHAKFKKFPYSIIIIYKNNLKVVFILKNKDIILLNNFNERDTKF